jgi:hypothetical protein
MINRITLLFIPFIFVLIACSDDSVDQQTDLAEIEIPEYFGTYLYNDNDCGGSDIQYATITENGITFFDFLGDNCDDTVSCYAKDSYELTEVTADTFLIVSQDGSYIMGGELYLNVDSSITLSYEDNNGPVEYSWEKIKDDISSFTPLCDQEYENTKDIADMMVYAVSDNGDLLWKNYIHGGIWDLGSSITPLSDGGYMVYGLFDAVNWGGCCHTKDAGVRDIIKLNSQGQEQWRKQIDYDDYSTLTYWPYTDIGKSLIETSNGDLIVIAPGLDHFINVIMMDINGEVIWTKNLSGIYYWSSYSELLENENGNIVFIGYIGGSEAARARATFLILDYDTGNILKQAEYSGLLHTKAIISVGEDFTIFGASDSGGTGWIDVNGEPIFLLKINSEGEEIWRKIWPDDELKPFHALDLISTDDNGYLLFCLTEPAPYATLIKTDSEGNEEWRKKYNDYTSGKGWIHQTEDDGYFMASAYAVTKLDAQANVEWNAAAPTGFIKTFSNGRVFGLNHDMRKIDGGAIMVGYGSASWE